MPPPMTPPAPVRLSITICSPRSSPILVNTTRLIVSIEEPGDCATMTRIGRSGYFEASAWAAAAGDATQASAQQASALLSKYFIGILLVIGAGRPVEQPPVAAYINPVPTRIQPPAAAAHTLEVRDRTP